MTAWTAPAIGYFPGCSLHGTSREYDESLRAVVAELGIGLTELDDWNCCGASSGHQSSHALGVALAARNLALAEAQGYASVLAPCAACYNRLAMARHEAAADAGLAQRLPGLLGRPFANTVEVRGVLDLLRQATPLIEERVAAALTPDLLRGVKVAAYYGCLLVRPAEVCVDDDPEAPRAMDEIVAACGADPVDWNYRTECCGGAFSVSRTGSVIRLGRAIIEDARAHGAQAIVVACPLCHSNLDLRQKAMMARGEPSMPVLFITQLTGLALGLPAAHLGLDRHFVDTEPFVARLVEQAAVRAAAEQKVKEEAAAKAAARAARREQGGPAGSAGSAAPDGDA